MTDDEDVLNGHLQELRRGTVVVAALATLRTPGYGYALLETLARAGFGVDANTLRFITATVRVDFVKSSDGKWQLSNLTVLKSPRGGR